MTSFLPITMFSVDPCCSMCQYFNPFYGPIIFQSTDILYFVYSFTHGHLDISTLGQLGILALWTFVSQTLWEHVFHSLGFLAGVESLGHKVTWY